MWTREQLKRNGKFAFQRNYWPCVGVTFIMMVVSAVFSVGSSWGNRRYSISATNYYNSGHHLYSHSYTRYFPRVGVAMGIVILLVALLVALLRIFIGNLLEVGGKRFFILNKNGTPDVATIFDGFKSGHYGNIVLTIFLRGLFISLWTLLLVIPGIVKIYEYLMVPYILAENPAMDRKSAFAISKRMMDGEKLKAFELTLSFLGWYFLSLITCGIAGIFYVNPYAEATMAELYAYNKAKAFQEGYIR